MNRNASTAAGMLERIAEAKRVEVEGLKRHGRRLRDEAESSAPARPFAGSLRRPGRVALIAEFKRRSPSAGELADAADPRVSSRLYAEAGAAAMSVLTDREFFGGSLDDLRAARSSSDLPVLRKDFVADALQIWEARAAGADAVLLIARMLDDTRLREFLALVAELGFAALVEVHDATELDRALAAGAEMVGINNRDLDTFRTDLGVSLVLAPGIPAGPIVVAESGIASADDVARLGEAGVDAVLVGESIMRAPDSRGVVRMLAGQARRARVGERGHERVRVKVCGVCRPEDAAMAVAEGADYVGVILTSGFGRTRSVEEAGSIFEAAGGAQRAGVFVGEDPARVVGAANALRLDVIQLHGEEDERSIGHIRSAGRWKIWKTIRARGRADVAGGVERFGKLVDGLLLEGWSERGVGGVGAQFDWAEMAGIREALPERADFVAAGGLTPDNVGGLIAQLQPDVVDVSSGVEVTVGRKSAERVRAFVAAVRSAGIVEARS